MRRAHITTGGEGGFTLMETLVMLIISAFAVTLMLQALGSFNQARQRIAGLENVRDNDQVALAWLGDSLTGLATVQLLQHEATNDLLPSASATGTADSPAQGLVGDSNGFSAQTLSPLLGPQGTLVTVHWTIVQAASGQPALQYHEPGHDPLILPLHGSGTLRFVYLDTDGKPHDNWPPQQGLQAPLPETVELQLGDGAHALVVARSPAAPEPIVPTPYAPPEDE